MPCQVIASGTRTNVIYWREACAGVRPPALTVAATGLTVSAVATNTFTVSSTPNLHDEGFAPSQWVELAAFDGTTAPSGNFKVASVADNGLTMDLYSEAHSFTADGTAAGTARIVPQTLRVTSKGFNLQRTLIESEEIRPSGMQLDVRHGFNTVAGSIGYELSEAALDDMLEGSLRGTFYTFDAVDSGSETVTPSKTAPDAVAIKFTRSAGSWIADGFRIGDWVENDCYLTVAVGRGTYQIAQMSGDGLSITCYCDATDGNGTLVVANMTQTTVRFRLAGKRLDAGTTQITFGMERQFLDVDLYQEFAGIAIQSSTLSLDPEAIVGGTMDVLGIGGGELVATSITASTATPLPTPLGTPYAWQDGSVYEGATALALVTSGQITFNNQRTTEAVVGNKFSPAIFEGTMLVECQIDAFLEDTATLFGKFYDESPSSAVFNTNDPVDPLIFLSVVLPNTKYTGADMDPPTQGPITQALPFRGLEATLNMPGATDALSSASIQVSNSIYA